MKVLRKNGEIAEVAFEEQEGKKAFWHTSAHVLAQAVKRLYPESKCAIGPAIENGFYYDFQFSFPFSEENLKEVEAEMRQIVKESLSLQVSEKTKEEAYSFMKNAGEIYKMELIEELDEAEQISFYKQGEYEEFCAGPHISNVCQIKAIKLLSVAGAYWRGNEKNPMLTRIYGISFPKASQLEEYLHMVEEAKARDHRKLGKELGIFTIFEQGPGLPVFLPKGMILKNLLIDYWRKIHRREGYVEIFTPIMLDRSLWETSGHWDFYRDIMYSLKVEDDAHILMREDQIMDEIQGVMRLIDEVYQKFGFSYEIELSTRPEHSIGRTWQCGTIQLDFQLPQRFDIEYIGADGEKHRPIMLHRVVFGSIERFIGILIEHYAGKLPAWLAPVQVKVISVSDKYSEYAKEVAARLEDLDVRVERDVRNEKLGYKIREARMDKVPYMVIVGEAEQSNQTVSIRQRDAAENQQELGEMRLEDLVELVKNY